MSTFWNKKHWMLKAQVPNDDDYKSYIGRHVRITDDDGKERVIEIERIVGNLTHPTKYEITSKEKQYLISMLDFHAQMNGEKVSKEEIELFDQTTMEHIVELPQRNKLWIPPHLRNPSKVAKN